MSLWEDPVGRVRRQPPPGEITGTVPDILPGGAALARACEVALYEGLQTRFGLGVDDPKHGFSEAALAAVMAAFDTHPEAGK
ncbi:N-hydroxyarylamine O-acetyltransferase [Klebsiella pneumoniae]|nr:N-hydroxyarylamine O-acetyltransferase [Klebsiella pneumoniae]